SSAMSMIGMMIMIAAITARRRIDQASARFPDKARRMDLTRACVPQTVTRHSAPRPPAGGGRGARGPRGAVGGAPPGGCDGEEVPRGGHRLDLLLVERGEPVGP